MADKPAETDEQYLVRLSPLRIIMVKAKDGNHLSQGVVEHSFAMGFDHDRVLVFWSGTAYSMLGTHTINAVEDAEDNRQILQRQNPELELVILDPQADDCPIQIDWATWLTDLRAGSRKFQARNAPWTIRDIEDRKPELS